MGVKRKVKDAFTEILSRKKSVKVGEETLVLNMPSAAAMFDLRQWYIDNQQRREEPSWGSRHAAQCVYACLSKGMRDRYEIEDVEVVVVRTGDIFGELAQEAMKLCGFEDLAAGHMALLRVTEEAAEKRGEDFEQKLKEVANDIVDEATGVPKAEEEAKHLGDTPFS